ncbi:MAG: hypothetical protein HQ556_15040 [Candidatus Marinimicrobia bacterium]|nr:hypothetical protein [Candidatus Neomarinimicrobiota bacterium]
MLTTCDQSPTTLDEEPYLGDSGETTFSMEISRFEFDYLSQQFFFSVEVTSPLEIAEVVYNLGISGSLYLSLNDLGQDDDILIGDGRYDGSWILPDSMSTYVDSLWTLEVIVEDDALNFLAEFKTLQPERPEPPAILSITHMDTLQLQPNSLVLDTLRVQVTHSKGLDEIKSVSLMSLKPDGTYANLGSPITLWDDGSRILNFYWGTWDITLTSGDKVAGDGIYSLVLPLTPVDLSGTYYWTFSAKTWLGVESIPLEDSLVVLPQPGLLKPNPKVVGRMGVFQ